MVVGVAIYLIRTRGGFASLSSFLVAKYGPFCAKLFLLAIAIRLFNEVWSNTKVGALYFGAEGSGDYWIAAAAITGFTLYYSWRGGLRSSLLTDGAQMIVAAVLLVAVLAVIGPGLVATGLPQVPPEARAAGMTFAGLALVQALSYGFHDPVLTDRAFITHPATMIKGFVLAGLIAGGFIVLFSGVGLYARSAGLPGRITFTLAGRRLAAIHGGVGRANRFLFASSAEAELADELDAAGVEGIIGGHCGLPFTRLVGDRLWHNAGVIGLPANDGTPRVWYGTLRPTTEGIIVETQALEYDHEAAARKMIECGLQGYAETLRSGLWPSLDVLPAAERDATGRPLASHSAFWTRQGLNPSRRDCAVP